MWLLRKVLGEELSSGIYGFIMVMVNRTNHQLRTIQIFQSAASFANAFF
jgi:hypothetical protein